MLFAESLNPVRDPRTFVALVCELCDRGRRHSGVDPATYAVTVLSFVACASVAGLIAALRLRRVSPMEVLRSE